MDETAAAEQRLADALRAHAIGGALGPGPPVPTPAEPGATPAEPGPEGEPARPDASSRYTTERRQVVVALLVALVAGMALGAVLAWMSVTMPGLLAAVG